MLFLLKVFDRIKVVNLNIKKALTDFGRSVLVLSCYIFKYLIQVYNQL